jgi:hypothetical protein
VYEIGLGIKWRKGMLMFCKRVGQGPVVWQGPVSGISLSLSLSLSLSRSLSLSLCGLRFRPRSDLSDEEIIHPPVSDKGLPIMLAWSPFAENARRDDSQRECVHTTSSDKPPQQLTSRRSCSAGLCGPCVAVATRRSLPSARC